MKTIYHSIFISIFSIVFLSSTCDRSLKTNYKSKQDYTSLDSTWLNFANAMESKNIDFLIENSLDSITCYDCCFGSDTQKEYFDSEFIFKNHLDKVMHISSLIDQTFSTYQVDSNKVRVIYYVKAQQAPEGEYGLIFTLEKKGEKYYFQGMMVQ
jgi:hypothetical protein